MILKLHSHIVCLVLCFFLMLFIHILEDVFDNCQDKIRKILKLDYFNFNFKTYWSFISIKVQNCYYLFITDFPNYICHLKIERNIIVINIIVAIC